MKNHCNDVIGRMIIILPEISTFVYENTELFQTPTSGTNKMAGNIPALDGPGSHDQPQSALLLIFMISIPDTCGFVNTQRRGNSPSLGGPWPFDQAKGYTLCRGSHLCLYYMRLCLKCNSYFMDNSIAHICGLHLSKKPQNCGLSESLKGQYHGKEAHAHGGKQNQGHYR